MDDGKVKAGTPAPDGRYAGGAGDSRRAGLPGRASPAACLAAAFVIAFSVLLIIPMWGAYGALFPKEGGHGHGHGGGDSISATEFEARAARFAEERRLPDGSVRAERGKPIYVVAAQYTFIPNTVRLSAGEHYELHMLSRDVVHAFSVHMGDTSYNAVVMPKMVTSLKIAPTAPGKYLVICNEYCGIGHDYMHFSLVVEEAQPAEHGEHHRHEQTTHEPEKAPAAGAAGGQHGHGEREHGEQEPGGKAQPETRAPAGKADGHADHKH